MPSAICTAEEQAGLNHGLAWDPDGSYVDGRSGWLRVSIRVSNSWSLVFLLFCSGRADLACRSRPDTVTDQLLQVCLAVLVAIAGGAGGFCHRSRSAGDVASCS